MQGDRSEEWRRANQTALRLFGLSGKPNVVPWKLAAALIVIGALVLAVSRTHSVTIYVGAVLWLAGAFTAILGAIRLFRLQRPDSN